MTDIGAARDRQRRYLRAVDDHLVSELASAIATVTLPPVPDRPVVEHRLRQLAEELAQQQLSLGDLRTPASTMIRKVCGTGTRAPTVLKVLEVLVRRLEALAPAEETARMFGELHEQLDAHAADRLHRNAAAEIHRIEANRRADACDSISYVPGEVQRSSAVTAFVMAALLADCVAPDGYCDPRDPRGPRDPVEPSWLLGPDPAPTAGQLVAEQGDH